LVCPIHIPKERAHYPERKMRKFFSPETQEKELPQETSDDKEKVYDSLFKIVVSTDGADG